MKRRLFNILAAVSVVLWLVALVLWIRSFYFRDTLHFAAVGGNSHTVQSILGRLHVISNLSGGSEGGIGYSADRLSPQAIWNGGMSGYPVRVEWHWGFVWQNYTRGHWNHLPPGVPPFTTNHRLIVITYWFPAAVFAMLPTLWLVSFVKSRRLKARLEQGLCVSCGYDLRASGDCCPECGNRRGTE